MENLVTRSLVRSLSNHPERSEHRIVVPGGLRNDLQHIPVLDDLARVVEAEDVDSCIVMIARLLPLIAKSGPVINLSSAAQSPVNPKAPAGEVNLSDHQAYAQSKLALTMWSRSLALSLGDHGPAIIAVNPGSRLATKMVKQAFGVAGHDVRIGADILVRAALEDEFAAASGQYFDNDSGQFVSPHRDALDARKSRVIVSAIETVLSEVAPA